MTGRSLIIVVTYNSAEHIEKCLRSVYAQQGQDFFVLVIDNASADQTIARIREFKNSCPGLDSSNFRSLSMKRNIGFARAVNLGFFRFFLREFKEGLEDFKTLVLLNPDLFLLEDALGQLCRTFEARQDCGAAGGLIMDEDCEDVTHVGSLIKKNFITVHRAEKKTASRAPKERKRIIESDYVTGALFACPIGTFCMLGGFDPGYRPAYFEELDFCLRLKRIGKRSYVNPKSRAGHLECASVSKFSSTFYHYYHKNRIRCAIVQTGLVDFFRSFLPAEVSWVRKEATRDQSWPLCRAYLVNLFFLPASLATKVKNHVVLRRSGRKK